VEVVESHRFGVVRALAMSRGFFDQRVDRAPLFNAKNRTAVTFV
jgi:hypothetical protein